MFQFKKIIIPIHFVLILLSSITAYAQLDKSYFRKLQTEKVASTDLVEWQQVGPGMAGYCEAFWCHPTDADVMFMSPDMYNTYGTWDGGKSWQTIKDVDGDGREMRRVQHIVFSPQHPDFGFAIDVTGKLYISENKGHKWTPVTSFTESKKYAVLAVDPTNDNIWYMGAGDFWNVKANHRSKANTLGNVYRFAAYGHILKSTDRGKTWSMKNKGLPNTLDVGRIIIDPTNNKNLIITTNSGVYKSTDQGDSWALSGQGLPNNVPRDMDYFYDKNTKEFILYCVDQTSYEADGETLKSKGGVFKSTDHGNTWQEMNGNLGVDMTQISNKGVIQKYWKTVSFWLGITDKKAKESYPKLPTNVYDVFNRLKVNPNNKDEIYLSHNVKHDIAFAPGDVWKTENGGKTWFATARAGKYWNEKQDSAYWQSRNTPLKANTRFAHLQPEINAREEEWGNRFLEMNPKGEVFICLDQQVMRTDNNGKNWVQIDDDETAPLSKNWVGRGGSNLPGRFMLLETGIKNRYLFCSGEHGLWQTAPLDDYPNKKAIAVRQLDGQVNTNPKGAHSIASVAVHPKDPNIIYTLVFRQEHRGFLRKSTDGGKTWKDISEPLKSKANLSQGHIYQYSLTIDPVNPDNIYFCVINDPITEVGDGHKPEDLNDYGVLKSADGGLTWAVQNKGFPTVFSVNRLTIDPKDPSVLYAALNVSGNKGEGGLYKSTDRANLWEKVKIPSEILSVNSVFVDRNTNDIFISCGRRTGELEEGGVYKSSDKGRSWKKIFDMPYIWQVETSPLNPNIITVVVAARAFSPKFTNFNPGAYLSLDGGKTWNKINNNLGQPDTITDFKPDPTVEGVYWCALKGSGWTVGYAKGVKKGWRELVGK